MTGHRPTEEITMAATVGGAGAARSTPLLRVVRGDATEEEVAALVTLLAALGRAGAPPAPAPRRTEWNAPHRLHRRRPPHGPGGWRASAYPH